MTLDLLFFAAIIICACFVQAVAVFGLPMIAMPVLVAPFGIHMTVPLMAIIILELQLIMILRYRLALNIDTVWRISAAAVLGINLIVTSQSVKSALAAVTMMDVLSCYPTTPVCT